MTSVVHVMKAGFLTSKSDIMSMVVYFSSVLDRCNEYPLISVTSTSLIGPTWLHHTNSFSNKLFSTYFHTQPQPDSVFTWGDMAIVDGQRNAKFIRVVSWVTHMSEWRRAVVMTPRSETTLCINFRLNIINSAHNYGLCGRWGNTMVTMSVLLLLRYLLCFNFVP